MNLLVHPRSLYPRNVLQLPVTPVDCHPLHNPLLQVLQSRGLTSSFCRIVKASAYSKRLRRTRKPVVCPKALVAVEWNPAVFIGLALVGGGLVLYQLRSIRPEISRDFDIVASSVCIFSGGILITQGWRMDPIIIFENLLMTGLLSCWTVEAIRLREELAERQAYDVQRDGYRRSAEEDSKPSGFNFLRNFGLPPPKRPTFTRWDPEGMAQQERGNDAFWAYGKEQNNGPSQGVGYRDRNQLVYPGEYSDVSPPVEGYVDDGQGFYRRPDPQPAYDAAGLRDTSQYSDRDDVERSDYGYNGRQAAPQYLDEGYTRANPRYQPSEAAPRDGPSSQDRRWANAESPRVPPLKGFGGRQRGLEEDWE